MKEDDGAVPVPPVLEGEALDSISSLHGQELCGGGGEISPHEQEAAAGHSARVVGPSVQGAWTLLPARGSEPGAAVFMADQGALRGRKPVYRWVFPFSRE